jgi:DNA-directed RNA polymerase, alpha subunit/40 kD subunit
MERFNNLVDEVVEMLNNLRSRHGLTYRELSGILAAAVKETDERERSSSAMKDMLNIPLEVFDLSTRTRNCLNAENITHVFDLVRRTEREILKTPNFGKNLFMS